MKVIRFVYFKVIEFSKRGWAIMRWIRCRWLQLGWVILRHLSCCWWWPGPCGSRQRKSISRFRRRSHKCSRWSGCFPRYRSFSAWGPGELTVRSRLGMSCILHWGWSLSQCLGSIRWLFPGRLRLIIRRQSRLRLHWQGEDFLIRWLSCRMRGQLAQVIRESRFHCLEQSQFELTLPSGQVCSWVIHWQRM